MNLTQKIMLASLALAGTSGVAEAQVKFKLSRQNATTYVVSMVPEKTLSARDAITGTMQVTLKNRAADGFEPGEIKSLQADVEWDRGSLLKSPDGAREFDYLSVALRSVGTRGFSYEAGKEVPLFSITNAGNAQADAQLIENNDALTQYSNNRYNVRNQISVLGYGRINAYLGNVRGELPTNVGLRQVFPNPATTEVTVEFDNYQKELEGDVVLSVAESGHGRVMGTHKSYMRVGTNRATLNVSTLTGGHYVIYLSRQGTRLGDGLKLLVVR